MPPLQRDHCHGHRARSKQENKKKRLLLISPAGVQPPAVHPAAQQPRHAAQRGYVQLDTVMKLRALLYASMTRKGLVGESNVGFTGRIPGSCRTAQRS